MTEIETSPQPAEEAPAKRRRVKKKVVNTAVSSQDMALKAARLAEEKFGEDILLLNVAEITSYTSYILLISAGNSRQTASLSSYLEDLFAQEFGQRPLSCEGGEGSSWLLLDYGDVIIHIFTKEERARYDLESFWQDADQIAITPATNK